MDECQGSGSVEGLTRTGRGHLTELQAAAQLWLGERWVGELVARLQRAGQVPTSPATPASPISGLRWSPSDSRNRRCRRYSCGWMRQREVMEPRSRSWPCPSALKLIRDGFAWHCANKSNFGEVGFSAGNPLISKERAPVKTFGFGIGVESWRGNPQRRGRQVIAGRWRLGRFPPSTYPMPSTALYSCGWMRMVPLKEVSSTVALPVLCVPSRLLEEPRGDADCRRRVMGRVLITLPFTVLALSS